MRAPESLDELLLNVREAVEGCLSVDVSDIPVSDTDKVMDRRLKTVSGKYFCRALEAHGE